MLKKYPVLSPEESQKFKDLCQQYGRELIQGVPFQNGYTKLKYLKTLRSTPPLGVYKAREDRTGKIVAIKICTMVPAVEFLESQISSRAQAKNHESSIVKLESKIWYWNGLYYIVMQYFSSDLHRFLYCLKYKETPIDELYLAFIIKKILHALCKLHSSGYCHLDVTPHNVFLSYCFKVKLGDLGKCRRLTSLTRKQIHDGKVGFASQERKKSEQEDIYQLGRTLLFYFFILQPSTHESNFPSFTHTKYRKIKRTSIGQLASQLCHDFLQACLCKNPLSPWKLLKHPFINQTRNDSARRKWDQFKKGMIELLQVIEQNNSA